MLYNDPVILRTALHIIFVLFLLTNSFFAAEKIPGTKMFTLRAAVDEECNLAQEKENLLRLIEEVSGEFEKEFHTGFSVAEWAEWQSENSAASIDDLAPAFFKQVTKKKADIAIGFTCQENLRGRYGVAFYEEGYILIRVVKDPALLKQVLKHELAHLFGATHVDDPDSLMDRFLRGDKIKEKNREIIELHRERNFKGVDFPAPSQNWQRLLVLYLEVARENEKLSNSRLSPRECRELKMWLTGTALSKRKSEKLQQAYSKLENVYIYLSLLYIEMKEYGQVIGECEKALRIAPSLYEAYNLMGIASRRGGHIDRAIRCYRNALKINRSSSKIYYNLGIAYAKKGDLEQALSAYMKAIELNPNFGHVRNNVGYIYLEQGNIAGAEAKFREAVSLDRFYPIAHSNLANVLLKQGKIDEACERVKKALALDPKLPGPHNILGMIYSQRGELREAEQEYREAISIDPDYYKGYANLGNIYLKSKEYAKAGECFTKAITINPKFAAAYTGLGDCYIRLGEYKKAGDILEKALKIDEKNTKIYLNLSFIKIKKGLYPAAISHLKKAIEIDPELDMAHQNLGIAYFLSGRVDDAERALVRAAEINPRLKETWSILGDLYLAGHEIDKARQAYEKSLAIDPHQGKVHNNLAVVYYYKKEYKEASRHIEEAGRLGFKVSGGFKKELEKHLRNRD